MQFANELGVDCQFSRVSGTKGNQHLIDEKALHAEANRALDFFPTEQPVRSRNGPQNRARKPGGHAEFPIENMRAMVANHFFPVMGVQLDGDRVPHAAGGYKQRG